MTRSNIFLGDENSATHVHQGGFTQPGLSKVMQPEISKWFKATNGYIKMNKKYITKETFWKNVYFGRYQNEQNATGLCIPGCVSEDKILSKIMQSNLSTVMQPKLSMVMQPSLSTVMQPSLSTVMQPTSQSCPSSPRYDSGTALWSYLALGIGSRCQDEQKTWPRAH